MPRTSVDPEAAQLGAVIRGARCAARMTQAQLGVACGYSASAISRVESGELRPDRTVMGRIANCLGLDAVAPGAAYHPGGRSGLLGPVPVVAVAATVTGTGNQREDTVRRRELLAGAVGAGAALVAAPPAAAAVLGLVAADPVGPLERSLFARGGSEPWTAGRIAAQLAAAHADFQGARYGELGARLPVLIGGAEAHRDAASGLVRERAQVSVARAYVLATELAVKAHADFAWVTADRALSAAQASGDTVAVGEAARVLAITMRRAGRPQAAVDLLARIAHAMDGGTATEGAVRATLLMTAAYTAAVGGQRSDALGLMGGAEESVAELPVAGRASDLFTVDASRAQCDLYWIGVHNALRTPDEGVAHARQVAVDRLPTPERRARFGTDTARMWHALGDGRRTFTALLGVERAAPQEVRRPALRALTADLLYGPGAVPGLRDFAQRTGAFAGA